MLQAFIDIAREKSESGINVIVALGGDLADRKNMLEEERDLIIWFVVELVRLGIHVVVINGNHDYYNEDGLTMIHPLHTMQLLCPKKLHVVVDRPGIVDIKELDVSFLCIPCQQDLTTKSLRKLLEKMSAKAKCSRRYGLVHEAINGSIANDNHKMSTKCDIPKHDLDGILLNDIHRYQKVGRAAWYSGSPLQVKSNEDLDKGILVWRSGITDPERVLLDTVPKIIQVDSEKALRKLEGTKHSVTYTGTSGPNTATTH
jgi:DNA repair exonuclease SbcCD nuclease subunit